MESIIAIAKTSIAFASLLVLFALYVQFRAIDGTNIAFVSLVVVLAVLYVQFRAVHIIVGVIAAICAYFMDGQPMPLRIACGIVGVSAIIHPWFTSLGYDFLQSIGELQETQVLRSQVRYSNPGSNHDHLKYKHSSRRSAELEVTRMKMAGYDESERLNVYFNRELDGWYVGRGWRRR
jgi:hypothetical protein